MNYFSMFTGIGGFEVGIQRALCNSGCTRAEEISERQGVEAESPLVHGGHTCNTRCVGYSEIDKHAIKTYERHFEHENFGDATNIKATDLPDFDLVVGGFPCQSFSIAGKRRGFSDTRGTLFFDIARILKHKRPRHLLLENVKGLLSHDGGKTFQTILRVLADLGYRIEWQVLNSKDFGVPQHRERVLIVGHLAGGCGRKIFPIHGIGMGCENPAVTLTARGYGSQRNGTYVDVHPEKSRLRRLTPIECERLQGFSDNWTTGSDNQRYKQCGNAVTTNVIEAVIERMKPCLELA